MYVQDVLQTLDAFWSQRGCLLWQPYHTEVGAGTSNPATFLRVLGPEPWWVAYPEPSTRPADGRYGENPNRLQHYYQYQVILKPSPPDVQELFLQSLEALGLNLTQHDFRFVEDNWQSPSLGAWGLGWEAWLDGMEILQFTYFQECGGVKLDVRACELTYGIERIAMYLQGVESVYDLVWAPSGITYGDIFHAQEVEYCKYNFEAADTDMLFRLFDMNEAEGQRLLDADLVLPAYDHCLRLSHLFNLLDARGALSVSERGRFLLRCRSVAERCAKAYAAQREAMGYPLRRVPSPANLPEGGEEETPQVAFNERDTLLLEVGVEELPHSDVKAVAANAARVVERALGEYAVDHGAVDVWVTPRRIAVRIEDMPAKLEDTVKEARGPKRAAAQDEDGNWTMPAQKFAEANGASPDDIYFQKQGKAEYCFVKVHEEGKGLTELVSEVLAALLRQIPFRKSMGWEDTTVTFSRPVRWLLALHGANVVPATWTLREASDIGPRRVIRADRLTYGHRRLAPGTVAVEDVASYDSALRERFVLVDRAERLEALREGAEALVKPLGLALEPDEDLLDEIGDLVEWPEPILCAIPEEALALPEPIIITPMKVHQRYIPLRNPDGTLSKHFLAVANGAHSKEGQEIIRVGNERVLNARLRDAKYFWDTDTKTPLAQFAEGLSNVLFHQQLGSVADKMARLRTLYDLLCDALPQVDADKIAQVLTLMKADLTTQMVGEFASLEGTMGMLYARNEGIDEGIARAILEHRLPRRAGDDLPSTPLGIAAGLLDRLDTLAGYFGIGIRVKGTSDPFGLRRNALAVLSIAADAGLDLDLESTLRAALENYGDAVEDVDGSLADLLTFFGDRLDVMAREEGYPHDVVAAALATHGRRPVCFRQCVEALRALPEAQVQDVAEQAKRIQRIVKEPADSVDTQLLEEAERPLHDLLKTRCEPLGSFVDARDFASAMGEIVAWAPVINTYFEKVLVNADDEALRGNRHALLRDVLGAMNGVADFTRIEKRDVEA